MFRELDLTKPHGDDFELLFYPLLSRYEHNAKSSGFLNNLPLICKPEKRTFILTTDNPSLVASDGCTIHSGVVGFCTLRFEGPLAIIVFFESFDRKQGYGTEMIEKLKEHTECLDREVVVEGPMDSSLGFWEKVGVSVYK